MDHIMNGGWAKRIREGAAIAGLAAAVAVLPVGITVSYAASPTVVCVMARLARPTRPLMASRADDMSFRARPGMGM